MSRRLLAIALGAVLATGCSETPLAPDQPADVQPNLRPGPAPFLPGEQQPYVDPDGFPLAIYPEFAGQNLSQTFTPRTNQTLGYLRLPVACAEGVLLNVKIRDGLGGTILYESNHAGLPTVQTGEFQLLQVYDPATSRGIRLRAGRTVAFELASFPGPAATANTCSSARGPAKNTYRGGQGWYRDPVNGRAWLPLPNGARGDDEDLPFITLVR